MHIVSWPSPPEAGSIKGFDQSVDVPRHLVSTGIYPLLILGTTPHEISLIRFVHDGSARSLSTWRWLIESNLWPEAILIIESTPDIKLANVEQALQEARSQNRRAEQAEVCEILVNSW